MHLRPVYLGIPALVHFLMFVQVYVGIPARPYEGWSVEVPPVRSTAVVLARIPMEDHALEPATTAGVCAAGCTPFVGFFAGGSDASGTGALRMRSVDATCRASGGVKNS